MKLSQYKNMKNNNIKKNLNFIVPIIILSALSILNMYGASYIGNLYKNIWIRQLAWICISAIAFIIIYKIDTRFLYSKSFIFYIIGVISLILVLFLGRTINGASSWFKIGPISFQPSEIFKMFYILFISYIISKNKSKDFYLLIKVLFLSFIPCILIFLEPDTGVVIMYFLMMFGMIAASKIKKRYIISFLLVALMLGGLFFSCYFFKKDLFIKLFGTSFFYRMDRLISFKNNSSYQLNNALIGVGSSGLFGFGLKSNKIYIPEITTDFVFDLTIINFGYLVGILVIILYCYILISLLKKISKCNNAFNKTVLSGVFAMMFFQVFEHIFMNLGLTPITGITLPFLSYGGSSLLSYAMLFALVVKT